MKQQATTPSVQQHHPQSAATREAPITGGAIELKVDRFEPEHLGKLNFYLEVLDRDHRKSHENPAIGVLLYASKDNEVVKFALSRLLSPAMIAE